MRRALPATDYATKDPQSREAAMSDDWIFAFTLLTALGCGLMAGVFFASRAS